MFRSTLNFVVSKTLNQMIASTDGDTPIMVEGRILGTLTKTKQRTIRHQQVINVCMRLAESVEHGFLSDRSPFAPLSHFVDRHARHFQHSVGDMDIRSAACRLPCIFCGP